MARINAENVYTETYENENYKIDFMQPYKGSIVRGYKVHDKKTNENSALLINMPQEECYNRDGSLELTFIKDAGKTTFDMMLDGESAGKELLALRPKAENRPEDSFIVGDLRKPEYDASGNLWHKLNPSIEGVMSIYKGLREGMFKEKNTDDKTAHDSGATSKEVLDFMDKYIFNTSESKEVLNEYLSSFKPKDVQKTSKEMNKKTRQKSFFAAMKSRLGINR